MSKVTGIVKAIASRGKAFNINVDETWYGFGFNAPTFEKGAKISFDITMNGKYANVDPSSVEVLSNSAPASASSGGGNSGAMDDRQKSICWQSARNAAIETAKFTTEQGITKIGTAKAKQYDVFMSLVDSLTERYYVDLEQLALTGEAPVQASSASASTDELDDNEGDE